MKFFNTYEFNESLANSLDNCSALTHINFGWFFNCPLANSLNNCAALTHIVFDYKFHKNSIIFIFNVC
jgi:hypothetical protein